MRSLILLFVMLTAASAHEASALLKKEFKNWKSEYFGPHYQQNTKVYLEQDCAGSWLSPTAFFQTTNTCKIGFPFCEVGDRERCGAAGSRMLAGYVMN